jgi:CRP/FNR family transcriptional regulator
VAVQIEFLKNSPYFAGIAQAELENIRKQFVERKVDRGEIITFEGEIHNALYFVVSGVVKSFKTSSEGKEQILSLIRPGESFNDIPAFDGQPSPCSTQAMGAVALYEIGKTDIDTLLQNNRQLALNVITVLAARVRHLVSLVEDLSFRHVIGRVARILLEHAGDGTGAGNKLTQQEMAAMAGTAREVVGRSLKSLEDDGIIRFDRHRIVISDKEALKEIVGQSV